MTTEQAQVDPFVAALSRELEAHSVSMPADMDPDMMFLSGLARSLLNRQHEIDDIAAWTESRLATLRREVANIKGYRLSEAMRCVQRLTDGKKAKSVKVPGMQFGTRAVKATMAWEPEDKEKLVEWAEKECPDALTVSTPAPRTSVLKTALVGYHSRTGRIPWGCTYSSAGEEPYARPIKKKAETDDE